MVLHDLKKLLVLLGVLSCSYEVFSQTAVRSTMTRCFAERRFIPLDRSDESVFELDLIADDVVDDIVVPVRFDFVNEDVYPRDSTITVSSNGQINIDGSVDSNCCDVDPIDGTYLGPRIAGAQADLDPRRFEDAAILWKLKDAEEDRDDSIVVSFENIGFYQRDGEVNFQVELFAIGLVSICFGDGDIGDNTFSTGVEDEGLRGGRFFPVTDAALGYDSAGVTNQYPANTCFCLVPDGVRNIVLTFPDDRQKIRGTTSVTLRFSLIGWSLDEIGIEDDKFIIELERKDPDLNSFRDYGIVEVDKQDDRISGLDYKVVVDDLEDGTYRWQARVESKPAIGIVQRSGTGRFVMVPLPPVPAPAPAPSPPAIVRGVDFMGPRGDVSGFQQVLMFQLTGWSRNEIRTLPEAAIIIRIQKKPGFQIPFEFVGEGGEIQLFRDRDVGGLRYEVPVDLTPWGEGRYRIRVQVLAKPAFSQLTDRYLSGNFDVSA